MASTTAKMAKASPCLFCTGNLNFASYLLATERLRFDHVETQDDGFTDFYFEDPNDEGSMLARTYQRADLEVGARSLLESRVQLLREIRRAATGARS
jgi:hypothetical protein